MTGPIELGPLALVLAASLVAINGALSFWLGLGIGRKLVIAAVRTVVQLLLLGLVLETVFGWTHPAAILAVCMVMITLASREAVKRTKRDFIGSRWSSWLAMTVGAGGTAWFATAVIVRVDPWWTPQYLIPLLGMMLGNGLTGISLGLDRCLTELDEGADRVELALAFGATRWEAARPVVAESLRTGLIPILNSMSVVGLVTIPGMMTGQILGGVPPWLAARYQILIMFLIAAATAVGTGGAVLLAVRSLFDDEHRLRRDRIQGV